MNMNTHSDFNPYEIAPYADRDALVKDLWAFFDAMRDMDFIGDALEALYDIAQERDNDFTDWGKFSTMCDALRQERDKEANDVR